MSIIFLRFSDGSIRLRNRKIELMDQDILYHLSLGSGSHDLVKMFGDVKVISLLNKDKFKINFILVILSISFKFIHLFIYVFIYLIV